MITFTSIQTRLIVAVVGLIAAIVGCFTLISFWQVNAGLRDNLLSKASVIISPFYELVARDLPVKSNNLSLFVRVQVGAKGVSLFPELVRVHADLQGLMFFEAGGKLLREEGNIKKPSEAVYKSIKNGTQIFEKSGSETLFVSIPFQFDSHNLGSTVLLFSIETIANQERRILITAITVFLMFLIFGILGAIVLAHSIAAPIITLTEKIGQGDLFEIDFEMKREDEVGILSRRFAAMRDSIHKQLLDLNTEIAVREHAENELRETFSRSVKQQEVISQLSVVDVLRKDNFNAAAQLITEKTSHALQTTNVSIWLKKPEDAEWHCIDTYNSLEGSHTSGIRLREEDYPTYFSEMTKMEPVAVHDVLNDPRTQELVNQYFEPNNILSSLYTGLYLEGELIGIICCDSVSTRREWKTDEITFITRIADQALLAMTASKRIEAEKALKRSENDLRITLNSIGDAVIATDEGNVITRMNPIAANLTGWNVNEALGKNLSEVFITTSKNSTHPSMSSSDDQQQISGFGSTDSTCYLTAKNSFKLLISVSGSPIRNDQGNIVGIVYVFRDITEQVEQDLKSRQAEKMQAVGQLAGGVAHDINNMLTGILGSAELLKYHLEDDPSNLKLVDIIHKASRSAADLVNQLLAFSRKGRTQRQLIDVSIILEDAVAILNRSIDKRITLHVKKNAQRTHVFGDASLLQNAIMNLALNARDAMQQGGSIQIHMKNSHLDEIYCRANTFKLQPGMYLEISVTDNGVGIPYELQQTIFEPFFTTKELGKGTGLGLSAVYGTASNHGGAITVYSEPGVGTTFNLYLPNCDDEGLILPSTVPERIGGDETILIIDDEEIVRVTVTGMLKKLGYKVLVAEHGAQGLDLFYENHNQISVVLLDMDMPKLSGVEVFRKIKSIKGSAKIIIVSGFSHDDKIIDLQKEGLSSFLQKPFSVTLLDQTLREVIHDLTDN